MFQSMAQHEYRAESHVTDRLERENAQLKAVIAEQRETVRQADLVLAEQKEQADRIEAEVLAKFGEPIGYFDPKEKRFIYDTTHPQYYLRAYAMKETK